MMQVIVYMVSPNYQLLAHGRIIGDTPGTCLLGGTKNGPMGALLGIFSVNPPRGGFSSGRFYGDCRYLKSYVVKSKASPQSDEKWGKVAKSGEKWGEK